MASNSYFSEEEANKKINKFVITLRKFSNIPFGCVGKVIGYYDSGLTKKINRAYGLTIEWQLVHRKNRNIFDGFSKDGYNQFLREIK